MHFSHHLGKKFFAEGDKIKGKMFKGKMFEDPLLDPF